MILRFRFLAKWNKEVANRKGYAENELLEIDTDNQTMQYLVTPCCGDDTYIKVRKQDISDLIRKCRNNGYALKI